MRIKKMQTDDLKLELEQLQMERCDCLLSIRHSSKCWSCIYIDLLYKELEKENIAK